MPKTALKTAAPAAPLNLPSDLSTLRNAPARLRQAEDELERAAGSLTSALHSRVDLAKRFEAAQWEVTEAKAAFNRERTATQHVDRRPTFTVVGGIESPAGIGLQREAAAQSVEYNRPVGPSALDRLTSAQGKVATLAPMLEQHDTVTIPELERELERAAAERDEALSDVARLEAAIIHHAAPALIATDARFAKAAQALEVARLESEAERERLVETFGYDRRFTAAELFYGLPAGIVRLVDARRVIDPSDALADRHGRAFALEN